MTRSMRPPRLLRTDAAPPAPPRGGPAPRPASPTAGHAPLPPADPRPAPAGSPFPTPRQGNSGPLPLARSTAAPARPTPPPAAPSPHPDEAVTAQPEYHESEPSEDGGAWALVKAAQAGDMAAYGELFERYFDVVFRFVLFRTGDRALAEDLTSETFVRALRRISSVSYQGRDIGAWFVTIARNLIFDHVKSSRYRLEQTTGEMMDHSPTTSGPEQQVLDGATSDELLRCVAKLNPDQQECIQLRFLQGLSVAETAAIMDRNEGAVKALQHRAVRRLAQLLPEGLR